MKIYTSYFSNYKNLTEYQCISIANSKPENIFIPTWQDVVPSWWMVDAFKQDKLGWGQFKQLYRKQLIGVDFSYIEKFSLPVVLLCWEKESEHCHRRILAEEIENAYGIIINEVRPVCCL